MADGDIDLTGEPTTTRRRRRRDTASGGPDKDKPGRPTATDSEVKGQVNHLFDQLVEWREAKDDHELAAVIREDGKAMADGIVNLTGKFAFLRFPVVVILNMVIPLLAFGRLGRILAGRWMARRYTRAQADADAQAAEWDGGEVPVT